MAHQAVTASMFDARSYDAYGGAVTVPTSARTGFSGETADADLPWYPLGSRHYVPSLRQFISPDTASPFMAGGLNRYAYCGGDPVNRIDPTGESFWDFLGASLGILGAAVGVVVTGGALLGAIGVAGGLAAAMSTTGGIAAAAATVLEVASVVVEVGSLASLAAGDERASGIFGWVALGTGLAAANLGSMAKSAAKSARLLARQNTLLSPVKPYLTSVHHNGGFSLFSSGKIGRERTVLHHHGSAMMPPEILHGRYTYLTSNRLQPTWSQVSPPGSTTKNWASHVGVTSKHVEAKVREIADLYDGERITVIMGGHGMPSGDNWIAGIRMFTESWVANAGRSMAARVRADYSLAASDMRFFDLGSLSKAQYKALTRQHGHVVHGFCYSMADQQFMRALDLEYASTYTLI